MDWADKNSIVALHLKHGYRLFCLYCYNCPQQILRELGVFATTDCKFSDFWLRKTYSPTYECHDTDIFYCKLSLTDTETYQ